MALDSKDVHRLKNQLAIIYGFADLMLVEMPPGDRHVPKITEIRDTTVAALEILNDVHRDSTEDQ